MNEWNEHKINEWMYKKWMNKQVNEQIDKWTNYLMVNWYI